MVNGWCNHLMGVGINGFEKRAMGKCERMGEIGDDISKSRKTRRFLSCSGRNGIEKL